MSLSACSMDAAPSLSEAEASGRRCNSRRGLGVALLGVVEAVGVTAVVDEADVVVDRTASSRFFIHSRADD